MKRMLTIALMLMLAGAVAAQEGPTDKGAWIIGGSISYTSQSGDMWENAAGDAVTQMQFMPQIGYFVAPKIMIGGLAVVNNMKQGNNELNRSGFGPVVGYYFSGTKEQVKGSIYPYIWATLLFQSIGDENDSDGYTSFGGAFGADYMLTNSVSLNLGIAFLSNSFTPDGSSASISGTTMTLGVGLGTFIY